MSRPGTGFGEHYVDDIIRDILRENASREKPIGQSAIVKLLKKRGINRTSTVVRGFADRMGAREYVTEEECDEIIKECRIDEREIIFIKKGEEGRTIGYWMKEILSLSEWMFLMDCVLYSKILTKKEADNLAKRITYLAGKNLSDLMKYRCRMESQPYIVGDKEIDEKIGHVESRVSKQVQLIREAIECRRKVKFNLCSYDYINQKVRLVPYGRHGKVLPETPEKYREDVHRVVSPFEVIFSNGRYYMLGADLETERNPDLKYKLYRVDLMDDLAINRAVALTKEEAGIQNELENLCEYRIENPYMFTGNVEKVRIRVDADQFTQIVDWFWNNFTVINITEKEGDSFNGEAAAFYDIDVKVNLNSFIFWILQYSGCVEVLGRRGDDAYRKRIKDTLKSVMKKYEED